MVAIASCLRARWLATALATPTPPTSSAVRATNVRNWLKRSTLRSSCGEALAPRANVPSGVGERRLRLFFDRCHCRVARAGLGQTQPILPAHQAAGLQQPACAQRGRADEDARPEADPAGELVRLAGERRAQLHHGIADADAIAGLEIEPGKQRRIDGGAERVALLARTVPGAACRDWWRLLRPADKPHRPP